MEDPGQAGGYWRGEDHALQGGTGDEGFWHGAEYGRGDDRGRAATRDGSGGEETMMEDGEWLQCDSCHKWRRVSRELHAQLIQRDGTIRHWTCLESVTNGGQPGQCSNPCEWCLVDLKRAACQCGPEDEEWEGWKITGQKLPPGFAFRVRYRAHSNKPYYEYRADCVCGATKAIDRRVKLETFLGDHRQCMPEWADLSSADFNWSRFGTNQQRRQSQGSRKRAREELVETEVTAEEADLLIQIRTTYLANPDVLVAAIETCLPHFHGFGGEVPASDAMGKDENRSRGVSATPASRDPRLQPRSSNPGLPQRGEELTWATPAEGAAQHIEEMTWATTPAEGAAQHTEEMTWATTPAEGAAQHTEERTWATTPAEGAAQHAEEMTWATTPTEGATQHTEEMTWATTPAEGAAQHTEEMTWGTTPAEGAAQGVGSETDLLLPGTCERPLVPGSPGLGVGEPCSAGEQLGSEDTTASPGPEGATAAPVCATQGSLDGPRAMGIQDGHQRSELSFPSGTQAVPQWEEDETCYDILGQLHQPDAPEVGEYDEDTPGVGQHDEDTLRPPHQGDLTLAVAGCMDDQPQEEALQGSFSGQLIDALPPGQEIVPWASSYGVVNGAEQGQSSTPNEGFLLEWTQPAPQHGTEGGDVKQGCRSTGRNLPPRITFMPKYRSKDNKPWLIYRADCLCGVSKSCDRRAKLDTFLEAHRGCMPEWANLSSADLSWSVSGRGPRRRRSPRQDSGRKRLLEEEVAVSTGGPALLQDWTRPSTAQAVANRTARRFTLLNRSKAGRPQETAGAVMHPLNINASSCPNSVALGPAEHCTLPSSPGQGLGGIFSPSIAEGKGEGWSRSMSGTPLVQRFGKALALGAVRCAEGLAWATPEAVVGQGVGSTSSGPPLPGACAHHPLQGSAALEAERPWSAPTIVPGEHCSVEGLNAGLSPHGAIGVPQGVGRGSFFGPPVWGRQDVYQSRDSVPPGTRGLPLRQGSGDCHGLWGRPMGSQLPEMGFRADGTLDNPWQRAQSLAIYGQHALAETRPGSSAGHQLQLMPAQTQGQFSPQTWVQAWHGAAATQALSMWQCKDAVDYMRQQLACRDAVDYMHEELEKARRHRQMWEAQEQRLRRAMAGLPLAPAGLGPIAGDMQFFITGHK